MARQTIQACLMAVVNINSKNGSSYTLGIAVRRSRCHHNGGIHRHQHHSTLRPNGAFESMKLCCEIELQIPNNFFALGAYSRVNDIVDVPAHGSYVIILTECIALDTIHLPNGAVRILVFPNSCQYTTLFTSRSCTQKRMPSLALTLTCISCINCFICFICFTCFTYFNSYLFHPSPGHSSNYFFSSTKLNHDNGPSHTVSILHVQYHVRESHESNVTVYTTPVASMAANMASSTTSAKRC